MCGSIKCWYFQQTTHSEVFRIIFSMKTSIQAKQPSQRATSDALSLNLWLELVFHESVFFYSLHFNLNNKTHQVNGWFLLLFHFTCFTNETILLFQWKAYIYKCTSHSILAHTKCLFCYCVCIKNNGGKVQENPWKHIASQKPYSNGFYKDADQIGAPSKMQRKNMLDWCMCVCVYIVC